MSARKPRKNSPAAVRRPPPQTSPYLAFESPPWWLWGALLLLVAAVYQPAWQGGLLWDDPNYFTRPDLQSLDGLRRIWFDLGTTAQYYPLTYSAFWLMHRAWGDATLGYHLVNIVLHATSAFILLRLLRRLAVPGAVFAALIFAVHPVHVESVAWMTELKNTLSGTLYLLAACQYLNFDETRRLRSYLASLGLFVLAMLTKTVTVTLPAALLVVIWWKRGRLRWPEHVVPALPLMAIGLPLGLVTIWAERTLVGAEGTLFQFTLIERCLIAGRVVWFYLANLVWPSNLIFIYPRWSIDQGIWWQYLFPLAAVALLAAGWTVRSRSRAPLAALLFFGGTLAPALGFVNVYPFQFSLVADHFQYLASIGVIALVAGGSAVAAHRWQMPEVMRTAAVGGVVGVLAILAWRQSVQYGDIETLYRTTIARNPDSWLAENNLGELEFHKTPPRLEDAKAHFQSALRIRPDYGPAHNNLGAVLLAEGRLPEALVEFTDAVRLQPRVVNPLVNLGNVQRQLKQPDTARLTYEEALRLRPDNPEVRTNLAGVLLELGRPREAVAQLTEALRRQPDAPIVRQNLAGAWTMLGDSMLKEGRTADALAAYQEALVVDPNAAPAHANLAAALVQMGRAAEAVPHLEEVVRLLPSSVAARANLNNVVAALQGVGPSR